MKQLSLFLLLLLFAAPILPAQVVVVATPSKSKYVQLARFGAEAGKQSKEIKPETPAVYTALNFSADDGYVKFISAEVIYEDKSRDTVSIDYVVTEPYAPASVISINKGAKKISSIIMHYTADPRKDGSTIIDVSATLAE